MCGGGGGFKCFPANIHVYSGQGKIQLYPLSYPQNGHVNSNQSLILSVSDTFEII